MAVTFLSRVYKHAHANLNASRSPQDTPACPHAGPCARSQTAGHGLTAWLVPPQSLHSVLVCVGAVAHCAGALSDKAREPTLTSLYLRNSGQLLPRQQQLRHVGGSYPARGEPLAEHGTAQLQLDNKQ